MSDLIMDIRRGDRIEYMNGDKRVSYRVDHVSEHPLAHSDAEFHAVDTIVMVNYEWCFRSEVLCVVRA